MLCLRVLSDALLSRPGIESVCSRVLISGVPYTLVRGRNKFYCCERF